MQSSIRISWQDLGRRGETSSKVASSADRAILARQASALRATHNDRLSAWITSVDARRTLGPTVSTVSSSRSDGADSRKAAIPHRWPPPRGHLCWRIIGLGRSGGHRACRPAISSKNRRRREPPRMEYVSRPRKMRAFRHFIAAFSRGSDTMLTISVAAFHVKTMAFTRLTGNYSRVGGMATTSRRRQIRAPHALGGYPT
jgi:hypothetical protein